MPLLPFVPYNLFAHRVPASFSIGVCFVFLFFGLHRLLLALSWDLEWWSASARAFFRSTRKKKGRFVGHEPPFSQPFFFRDHFWGGGPARRGCVWPSARCGVEKKVKVERKNKQKGRVFWAPTRDAQRRAGLFSGVPLSSAGARRSVPRMGNRDRPPTDTMASNPTKAHRRDQRRDPTSQQPQQRRGPKGEPRGRGDARRIPARRHAGDDNRVRDGNVETVDVLIVGAGVSGLFAAARIREHYPHLTVALVERGAIVGGRLQSLRVEGSKTAVELGAMRTFPDIDHYTAAVLRMTDVSTVEVPYVTPRNIAYLRGERTRMRDLPKVAARLYNLPAGERGKPASALIQNALDRELAAEGIVVAAVRHGVATPAPDGDVAGRVADIQCAQRTACGDPALGRITFWRAVLDRGLSQQGFDFALDASGYDFTRGAVAAAAGIRQEYSLSGLNSPQHWIVGGFRTVTTRLYEQLVRGRRRRGAASAATDDRDGTAAAGETGHFKAAFNTDLVGMRLLHGADTVTCETCRHGERHATVECRLRGTRPDAFIQRDPLNVCGAHGSGAYARDDGDAQGRSNSERSLGAARAHRDDDDDSYHNKRDNDNSNKNGDDADDEEWVLRAHHVILSAPRDDLVRIDAPWPPVAKAVFGAVEAWRAVKVYLWFERAWWADARVGLAGGGKNVSDLPARQVWFPFGDRLPVALIYVDQEDSDFWVDLLPGAPDAVTPLRWHPADRAPRLVAEALRQIGLVTGVDRAHMGRVDRLVWRHWPYGTVFWRSERHPAGSISAMRRKALTPLGPPAPVLAVGDSFAWSQGWVDGAIETADLALRTYWAIPTILAPGSLAPADTTNNAKKTATTADTTEPGSKTATIAPHRGKSIRAAVVGNKAAPSGARIVRRHSADLSGSDGSR
ncbi:NAD(P) binding domain containing protein [Pandoravirus japonicus]|uniref:NAD(P) binding domain containing protein n=1 Tax=Pandoravirus japonicus TaxID=2823154 RepID=A0A811BSS1_9VIRU|nr:NAD(P) binding domain containing protein [Pandoravirus japonicus]